jgi:hypothetical protein
MRYLEATGDQVPQDMVFTALVLALDNLARS